MGDKKQKENEQSEQTRESHNLACHICGRIIQPEECSWLEDDGGQMCCQDCKAERESCGCSD